MTERLPRSWAAALDQLRRDVTLLGRRAAGYGPPPLIRGGRASSWSARPAFAEPVRGRAAPIRGRADARELMVAHIVRETESAVTLVLRAPGEEAFTFQPGQFFTVLAAIGDTVVPRNYSASNAPGEAELHLTIKEKAGGKVSPVLCRMRAGDTLRVLGPFGAFGPRDVASGAPNQRPARRLVLVAGGSGVTPLASIARTILATEPASTIALLYANRCAEDVIFASALAALAARYPDRLTLVSMLERPPSPWSGEVGRLDRENASRVLAALPIAADASFYVCGPDGMRDAVLLALASRGVASDAVHVERFSTGPRPTASPAAPGVSDGRAPGAPTVAIRVRDRTVHAAALPGATLLEAGLAAGVAMPFSCAVGGCGACRVKLIDGQVELEEPNCLSAAERAAGFVLACVGRPAGPCTVEVPADSGGS